VVQNVQPLRSVQPPRRGSVQDVLNGLNDLNDLNGSEATTPIFAAEGLFLAHDFPFDYAIRVDGSAVG
jgi:hypothetical protein